MRRGRAPFDQVLRKKMRKDPLPPGVRRHMPALLSEDDTTPAAVRAAAYRVEARRSLLAALVDVTVGLLFVVIAVAGVVAGLLHLGWGLAVAVAGAAVAVWLYR